MSQVARIVPIILLLSFLSNRGYCQTQPATGKVTGKVVDAKNNPISYATVTIIRNDSSVAGGDLTKDDGSFSISPTGIGVFSLRVNAIGLKTVTIRNIEVSAANPEKNVGNIKVGTEQNTLKEVSVVGEKPLMEMQVDKKVFNVEKNITTAGGAATDVLQNIPSVSVDVDGTVSLRGKSDVTILIDGKPATLLGGDVQSALQSLPASSIESIEVITNPSAKYDAQGLTGIINIITKKDGRLGVNGSATLGAGTRDKYNGNLGLNVRKGKWNLFLNSSFRINNNYNHTTVSKQDNYDSSSSYSHEQSQRQFAGFFNSIGASYDFDKNNSITFTQNINKMDFSYSDPSVYIVYGNRYFDRPYADSTYKFSSAGGGPLSLSSAIDYKHKFKKKDEELNVDATYSISNTDRWQHYGTTTDSITKLSGPIMENAPSTNTNNSFNAWADFTDPLFTKNGKLGLGWKSQFYSFKSSNNPLMYTLPDTTRSIDYTLYADFNYTQYIHAAYVNWNDQIGKFSYQAGLRAEDAVYNGTYNSPSPIPFSNNYLSLFPSAFVSYQLPAQQSVYLNYSRRTNRPWYRNLIPFKDLSNPSVVEMGNPGLNPEFINNIEFSYNKQTKRGDNIILSSYYQYTQGLIERISTPIDTGAFAGRQFEQPVNLTSGITYGIELTGHVIILPFWDATVNFNLFQNDISLNDSTAKVLSINQSSTNWLGKINTNIKLPRNFSIQINAQYESPKAVAQGQLQEVYWMDAAIRKNFLKNKATLVLNVSDIFNTRKYNTIYQLSAYDETYYRDRETRVGNITFTYRFGKSIDNSNPATMPGGGKKGKKQQDNSKPNEQDRENNLKQGDENNSNDQSGQNSGTNGNNNSSRGMGAHS